MINGTNSAKPIDDLSDPLSTLKESLELGFVQQPFVEKESITKGSKVQ